mgnify:CR=1 FL=1
MRSRVSRDQGKGLLPLDVWFALTYIVNKEKILG